MIGLLIGAVVRELNKRFNVPYTPLLFVIGLLLGYYKDALGILGDAAEQVSNINPHGILMIFLPPLIFESGFNSDWHIFRKQSKQIAILAFPSVVVSATLIMISLKLIIGYEDEYYTWVGAFLFGAILSCTDTVAVLALLKEVGAPKKLNSLIEGESLLNDATCMILFSICAEILSGNNMPIKNIIVLFISLTVGGVILGLIFGMLAAAMINRVRNDPTLTLNITFCGCFILYFVAENVNLGFRVSGIMALVSMGLYMAAFGKTQISAEAKETVHSFWKYIIYVA
jgi:NhaP-type Na+/H+ or K+/H+ antiporter